MLFNCCSKKWSPEQISLWQKPERVVLISYQWVYQFVLQDKLLGSHLYRHPRCRRQYGSYSRLGQLIDQVSIDVCQSIVDQCQRIDDWEIDTIVSKGHQQTIISLIERKSRYALIRKVIGKTAESVSSVIIHLLKPLAYYVKTLISGNMLNLRVESALCGRCG